MILTKIVLALGVAMSPVLAHMGAEEDHLSVAEIVRRSDLSKRCEAQAAAMNQKRWIAGEEKRRSLRKRVCDTTTVEVHTQAPHFSVIQNNTCVLSPEVTTGPYIFPRSQILRQDMAEGEEGVPVYLDIGVLDTTTCEPLEGVLVDLWHCNSTGSYSSFTGLDPNLVFPDLLVSLNITNYTQGVTDLHTDETTFLRGMWPTDANGVSEIKTVFPGFYAGRAIHIHAQVHTDWVVGTNGTIISDKTVHTGQFFFQEELTAQIMALSPYVEHTQVNRTTNNVDRFLAGASAGGYNPFFTTVPADGVDYKNGIIAYITMGVDSTKAV